MSKTLPTLLLLIVFAILVSLGFWQLDRAEEKKQIELLIAQSRQQSPVLINPNSDLSKKNYYLVRLNGTYDNKHQFIYDNQTHNHRAGYHVLTPFHLSNSSKTLLVNRGFIAWGLDRGLLANVDVSQTIRTISVEIREPKIRPQFSQTDKNVTHYPHLIQALDIKKIVQQSQLNLLPVVGLLQADNSDGFIRVWQAFYGSVDKHIAYAIQWFLMAIVLLILSVYLLRKNTSKARIS